MDFLDNVEPWALYTAAVVGLLTVIVAIAWGACGCGSGGRARASGRTILILGSKGAGKTALFYRMIFGTAVDTHTSMKPNTACKCLHAEEKDGSSTSARPIDFVDVPGHRRIRQQLVKKYVSSVGGILFLVDGVKPQIRSTSEYLYDILTDPTIDENAPPILIMSNKSDNKRAKSADELRKCLEAELSELKETRASLAETGENGESDKSEEPLSLGLKDEDFSFDRHSPCPVEFFEGSALKGDFEKAIDFVRACVPA